MATSRKNQDSWAESHNKHRHLVNLSPTAIFFQCNRKIIFINTQGVNFFKALKPDQFIGKSVTDFVSPDYRELFMKRFLEAKSNKTQPPPFKTKLIRNDGTKVFAEISTESINYQSKPAIQISFSKTSQLIKSDELFFQAQQDWKDIFNSITDMITIHDKNFNIIYANKSAEKLLNLPFLTWNKQLKCFRYYHGTETPPEGCPSCNCLTTGKPANFELFEPHLGVFIEIRAMPRFDNNKQLIGLVHVVRDVTRRKKAEEELQEAKNKLKSRVQKRTLELSITNKRLREKINEHKMIAVALRKSENKYKNISQQFHALLDGIPDNLVLLSQELEILWVNKAAVRKSGQEILSRNGQYCYKVCCDSSSPCVNCPSRKSFSTGREENAQIITPQGRILDIRSFPIEDDNGNVKNVIELIRDITEKINLEAETMRTRHLASLGELAAGVAHEINNPINNIINYAQILLDDISKKTPNFHLSSRIMKDSERIATIVRSLLSFARIKKEEKNEVDLKDIFSDTLALTATQLNKEGTILKHQVPPDLPLIHAHIQQIQQVFLNIISNARFALNAKYPEAHENKILAISCKEITIDGSPFIRIIFRDNGTGITPNIMNKVINPFFSTKPTNIGTGLGLSISHGIISEHGGKLTIESTEHEYTRIIIELPAAKS
jgi:PAS domain S-box-containing protein